ncbi:MAG TPA: protein kinase [Thermoanaerobaculia bacterium]
MALAAGTRLGTYEILAPLGAGGMGEVYRARDSKLDRDVAIKVLPDSVANDSDSLARFEREAKAVAALSHPNILAIFDFGRHDGVAYAVTELLEGESLRGRLDGGVAIPQRQAVDWGLQIARGLSAAHERGIVHRDLKPENVFVTLAGHVKILDFGLAKKVEAPAQKDQSSAPTGSGHTEPGTVLGTMGYMSPEQVRGLPVDPRSDIFSLGAVLYELLSGKKAFKRNTASDTIAAILKEEAPELTGSGRSVPPALDHIVRHCLEKEPSNRFQSAKDVAFALNEASGPGAATGAQASASGRRGKARIIVAALVIAAAAIGILLARRPHGSADAGVAAGGVKRLAVLPFENLGAPEDDYFADGIADEVRGKLTAVKGLEVIARGSSTPYKKSTKTPQEIAKELDAHYLLTATVRWQKGAGGSRVQVRPELVEVRESSAPASRWQQSFDAAITDVFQVQSDIATKVAQALGGALGSGEEQRLAEKPTENLAAYDAFLKGEAASAGMSNSDPLSLRKALGFYEQAVALDPGFVQGWARVSTVNSALYYWGLPSQALDTTAKQAAEKTVALAPRRPEGYQALGDYQRMVKADFEAALQQYAKGQSLGTPSADVLVGIGLAEGALGRWDAAVDHLKQAARLDPRSVVPLRRLGDMLVRLRRFAEAREVLDRALALAPSNLASIEGKTMSYLGEGNLKSAREVVQAASTQVGPTELVAYLATYEDLVWVLDEKQRELLVRLTPSSFDDDRGSWALCLTEAYALGGDAMNTRRYAEEARAAYEEQLRGTPDNSQQHSLLGLSLAYLSRREEAVREGLRGVELSPISKSSESGAYNAIQLARIYALVGEPDKAIDQLESLLKVPCNISAAWISINPFWAPLHSSPRYQKLVAQK